MLIQVTQGRGFYEHPVFGRDPKTLRLDYSDYRLPGAFWDEGLEEAAARLLAPSRPYKFIVAVSLAELLSTMYSDITNKRMREHFAEHRWEERINAILTAPLTTVMQLSSTGGAVQVQPKPIELDKTPLPNSHFDGSRFVGDLMFLRRVGMAQMATNDKGEPVLYPTQLLIDRVAEMEKNLVVQN